MSTIEHKNIRKIREEREKNAKNGVCRKHPTAYSVTDSHTGDYVCSVCGLVIEGRMMTDEAEWRIFENDTEKWSKSRVGATENRLLGDNGNLGTTIQMVNGGERLGTKFGENIRKMFNKQSVDRALICAFSRIAEMSERINLPRVVVERAQLIYNNAYRKMNLKGKIQTNDAKVAASIYIACRREQCSRTSREIAAISESPRKEILSATKRILNTMPEIIDAENAIHLIGRICYQLNLSNDIKCAAIKIIENVMNVVEGRHFYTETIAGASIYLAQLQQMNLMMADATIKRKIRERVAQVINLSPGTIERVSKLLGQT